MTRPEPRHDRDADRVGRYRVVYPINDDALIVTVRPKAKYFATERTSIKILNFCLHSLDENRHYHQIRSAVSHQNALEFGPWRQKNAELSSNVRIFNARAPGCWNLGFTPHYKYVLGIGSSPLSVNEVVVCFVTPVTPRAWHG